MTTAPSKNLLITGASGFIGSHVVSALEKEGSYNLLLLGRTDVDLSDICQIAEYMKNNPTDLILHLAGSIKRGEDLETVARQWQDTFFSGANILTSGIYAGCKHLILVGSFDEFDCDLNPAPGTNYGLCKHLLKQTAQYYSRKAPVRIDWFRPPAVYGPGQEGEMLIPYAFRCATENETALFTSGKQKREFLYIDDLVAWIKIAVAKLDREEKGFHEHNLGSGQTHSVKEVVNLIAGQFVQFNYKIGEKESRKHEPSQLVIPKYRNVEIDWTPRYSLEEGISKTADWWKHRSE